LALGPKWLKLRLPFNSSGPSWRSFHRDCNDGHPFDKAAAICSRRKICSKVRLTDVVPAPDEPVTRIIGYFADTAALFFGLLFIKDA
jgi:hypothetical protein